MPCFVKKEEVRIVVYTDVSKLPYTRARSGDVLDDSADEVSIELRDSRDTDVRAAGAAAAPADASVLK